MVQLTSTPAQWLIFLGLLSSTLALDNGLALTPPMGWLTWQRFRCTVDCKNFPNECISEDLIKRTADLMVSEGYLEAGYEYVGIDDCWLEKERGPDGRMVPDRERFPSGMKALADYIHNRGLKFGMYQDYGTYTCGGYPGVIGYEKLDVETFVEWEIDYLKLDGCYMDVEQMDEGYPAFGKLLNESGRPILYSCSWPAYQEYSPMTVNYASIAEHCNLWRNYGDIQDSWSTVSAIVNWFGDNQERFAHYAGPGHWNDPDMLIIGNYGLSIDQAQAQMALWAAMAAPLLISADLATMRPEFKEILLNREVIAVNQDKLGKQGLRIYKNKNIEVWQRELSDGCYALVFMNQDDDGMPSSTQFSFYVLQLPEQEYFVQDLFNIEESRFLNHNEYFSVRINPTGARFFKLTPKGSNKIENSNRYAKNVKLDLSNELKYN